MPNKTIEAGNPTTGINAVAPIPPLTAKLYPLSGASLKR